MRLHLYLQEGSPVAEVLSRVPAGHRSRRIVELLEAGLRTEEVLRRLDRIEEALKGIRRDGSPALSQLPARDTLRSETSTSSDSKELPATGTASPGDQAVAELLGWVDSLG